MRNLDKRLSAVEAYIETRVEEGLRRELEAALEILEERLAREEFARVARILAEMGGGE
jgi:DNA-binding LytR/AlgR family response regulator